MILLLQNCFNKNTWGLSHACCSLSVQESRIKNQNPKYFLALLNDNPLCVENSQIRCRVFKFASYICVHKSINLKFNVLVTYFIWAERLMVVKFKLNCPHSSLTHSPLSTLLSNLKCQWNDPNIRDIECWRKVVVWILKPFGRLLDFKLLPINHLTKVWISQFESSLIYCFH